MTIKALKNRLARVESAYRQILQCDLCRVYALDDTPSPHSRDLKNPPADVLVMKCFYCGTRCSVPVGLDKYDRMIVEIIVNSHPSEQFTDERVHAAFIYCRLELKDRNDSPRKAQPVRSIMSLNPADQRKIQEREQLQIRASAFRAKQVSRIEKIAKGPTSFPIDETFLQLESKHHVASYGWRFIRVFDLDMNDYNRILLEKRLEVVAHNLCVLKKRIACEKIILRKPLSKTVRESESLELEIEREFENAVNSYREEESRQERERLERERLERERL